MEVLEQKWYAVKNDLIGGWCIRLEDTPPSSGGPEIADFMNEDVARYIVFLHNQALEEIKSIMAL